MKRPLGNCLASSWLRSPVVAICLVLFLAAPAFGQQGNSPWENAVNVLMTAFERSRWRDGRFACYAPYVMPQGRAFDCDFRFSVIFLSQAKSIGCKRKKIQFP